LLIYTFIINCPYDADSDCIYFWMVVMLGSHNSLRVLFCYSIASVWSHHNAEFRYISIRSACTETLFPHRWNYADVWSAVARSPDMVQHTSPRRFKRTFFAFDSVLARLSQYSTVICCNLWFVRHNSPSIESTFLDFPTKSVRHRMILCT